MIASIVKMEKSNNIMNIIQNMNVQGVTTGHSKDYLYELNTELLQAAKEIKKLEI